jgi:hypothetical protein
VNVTLKQLSRPPRGKKSTRARNQPGPINRGLPSIKAKLIPKRKRGRPKKSECALSGKRLPRQRRQTLAEILSELPRECASGAKKNSKGQTQY